MTRKTKRTRGALNRAAKFLEREAQEYEDAAEPGDDIFLKIAKDYRRTAKQLRLLEEEIQRKNLLRPASKGGA